MKVETKYNIGDKVFVLTKNKIKQLEIFLIKIHIGRSVGVIYVLIPEEQKGKRKFREEQCFTSKEELLQNFQKED